ncbi:HU family DNA-binding protein [Caminibacter sp.]
MKKNEFLQYVIDAGEYKYKTEAEKAVNSVLKAIENALKDGKKVSFIGFGSFEVVEKAARETKVPGTDKIVKVPAHKVVKFKAGSKLKELINS